MGGSGEGLRVQRRPIAHQGIAKPNLTVSNTRRKLPKPTWSGVACQA